MNDVVKLLLFLPLFFTIADQSSPKPSFPPPHSVKQNSSNETIEIPLQHYFEITLPLPTDDITPACSTNHTFENTTGSSSSSPVTVVDYTPPPATCDWSVAVLELRVECKGGEQHDGVAGVWIDGVELLRTSTAQPNEDGIFWNVRKDVSRYSSIITQQNLTLSVVFGNHLLNDDDDVNGVYNYNVNASFLFYSGDNGGSVPLSFPSGESEARSVNRKLISVKDCENEEKLGLDRVMKSLYPYDTPADLIIPISGAPDDGFWFEIHDESDVRTTNVQIPQQTYKLVLELYVSFHGDDEFWYMNPPDSYIKANNLPITNGKGAYREVLVTIDGKLVGTVIPFPVISPGGINPLFWTPVVSIGAFDLPSYDIDLTPFLSLLLDDVEHSIAFQVADGVSFWLVDANLHIWLDDSSKQAIVEYEAPSMEIEHQYEFKGLDGEFQIEAERSTSSVRWAQSSKGVLKTKVTEEIKFKNKLRFINYATRKELEQTIKTKTKTKITDTKGHSMGETVIEKIYPLKITIETGEVSSEGSSLVKTTVIEGRSERFSDESAASISRVLNHDMNCTGWMMVKGSSVISGSVENHQNYSYKDDEGGCYSRKVDVVDGDVIGDETTPVCVN